MKKLIILITLVLSSATLIAQTKNDRTNIANQLNTQFIKDGGAMTCSTGGTDAKMLIFGGRLTDSYSSVTKYVHELSWEGFKMIFDTYKFDYVCFVGVDKCYSRSEIQKMF